MEIPELVLENALELSNSSAMHESLSSILLKYEAKSVDVILDHRNDNEVTSIDREVFDFINSIHYHSVNVTDEKLGAIAQIIATLKFYLAKGVRNSDVKAILIFLSVNSYLKIDLGKIFDREMFSNKEIESLSEKISQVLGNVNIFTTVPTDAPYHEKQYLNEYIKGLAEHNINKAYDFIEALERGGRGMHINYLLEQLLLFLMSINSDAFVSRLLLLNEPKEYVFYLQSLSREHLIEIGHKLSKSSNWLSFEIIRQIISKEVKEGEVDEKEKAAIKKLLDSVKSSKAFLKQSIKYFSNSNLFNAALGSFLARCSNDLIEEIITECLPINQYSFNLDQRNLLLYQFDINASIEQLHSFLKTVFDHWFKFLKNLQNDNDFFLNEILITDYAHYIISYFSLLAEDEEVLNEMSELCSKIKHIDSEWTTSRSKQITLFHLYHSKLFLLTFAYRDKKLSESSIAKEFTNLISNPVQLLRYASKNTISSFQLAENNMLMLDGVK